MTFGYPASMPLYPDEQWRNYTSNVSPMWAKALGGESLGDLIDRLGGRNADLIPHLDLAVRRMRATPALYRAMNPRNGWGDYAGALKYLVWMRDMCRAVPEGNVVVWR